MDDMQFREKLRRYYALWREDNEIYGEWAQARGFSYFELMVLSALAEGGRTQRAICDQWSMSKQTVHSILRLFLARGVGDSGAADGGPPEQDRPPDGGGGGGRPPPAPRDDRA